MITSFKNKLTAFLGREATVQKSKMETAKVLVDEYFANNKGAKCVSCTQNKDVLNIVLEAKGREVAFQLAADSAGRLSVSTITDTLQLNDGFVDIVKAGFSKDKASTSSSKVNVPIEVQQIINAIDSAGFRNLDNLYDILELINKLITDSQKYCVICGGPLEYPSEKPSACGKQECQYKAEEIFLDDQVVIEIAKKSPEVFKFLIDTTIAAIKSKSCDKVFEPFPARFLVGDSKDRYVRGEIGALTGNKVQKDFSKLQSMVSVLSDSSKILKDIIGFSSDSQIRQLFGDDLFYLIRFIVKSNCTHLEPVQLFDENTVKDSIKQFKIRYPAEKEAAFQARLEKEGQCYLFHGSREENWHSILRNGLRNCSGTALQRNGAAYGQGIYLSSNYGTSLQYSAGNLSVIGVCELVGKKERYQKSGSGNICTAKENDLLLRYLFVGKYADISRVPQHIVNQKFGMQLVVETKSRNEVMAARGNKRLMREISDLQKEEIVNQGFRVAIREDNLYIWDVWITDFGPDAPVTKDMNKHGITEVHVEIRFPDTGQKYPIMPPFVRIISPRFQFHTGHITIGGSFCIELLTPQGWSSVYKIESLLIQLKALVLAGGARLDPQRWDQPYVLSEAKNAFSRVAKQHGWL